MTKEEVIISLGLDHSGVQSGMRGADFLIKESIGKTMKSLKNIVAINLVELGIKGAEIWDKFTQSAAKNYYEGIYQANESVLDSFRVKFRQLVSDIAETSKLIKKSFRDYLFDSGTEDQKLKILKEEEATIIRQGDAIKASVNARKQSLEFAEIEFKGMESVEELRLKYVQENAEAQIALNKLGVEHMKNSKEISKLEKSAAEEKQRRSKQELIAQDELIQKEREKINAGNQAGNRLADAKSDRLGFSLEEMASDPSMQGTRWGREANEITKLRGWAKWNSMHGNFDKANNQMSRADKMEDSLRKENPFLRNPLDMLNYQITTSNIYLGVMAQNMKDGLNIKPHD